MNSILEDIYKNRQVQTSDGKTLKLTDAVSADEGKFLSDAVSAIKPKVSLEIGMAYGISTLFICEALSQQPTAHHIAIDPFQFKPGPWGSSWEGVGIGNVKKAGYSDIVELIELPSFLALPQLIEKGVKIDFAFIDGWHTFDYVLTDFFFVDQLLDVGGYVAFDDAHWISIQKVLRYIITNKSYSVFRTMVTDATLTWKQRLLTNLGHSLPTFGRLLKSEYTNPSVSLGLAGSRCIVLRKDAPDTRAWNFHHSF